jgi:DNA processing protein
MEIDRFSAAAKIWALMQYGDLGPRAFRYLLTHLGAIDHLFSDNPAALHEIEGLSDQRAEKLQNAANHLKESEAFISSLAGRNINFTTFTEKDYPRLLDELNDPPPLLFFRGRLPSGDEKTAAIVGTRRAGTEGINIVVELSRRLAEKSVGVISGLVPGIDTAAHIGCLKGNGSTFAVLASGLDEIYPSENLSLAGEIIRQGGIISEYAPEIPFSESRATTRNRLIVGLSRAVIINEIDTEATGTLDTAKFCHEIGKLMFLFLDPLQPNQNNPAADQVLKWGAIPVWMDRDLDMVIEALV